MVEVLEPLIVFFFSPWFSNEQWPDAGAKVISTANRQRSGYKKMAHVKKACNKNFVGVGSPDPH